jgi:hypothetical protein
MKLNEIASSRALKTKKGSLIKRSKFGVGKLIGGYLYLHRNYINDLPPELKQKIIAAEEYLDGFEYNTVKVGLKNDVVTFINSSDFDESPEPTVGKYVSINSSGDTKTGSSNAIWHHKWLWVKDDYQGFDVEDSFERSKKYLEMDIDFSRIGNKTFWEDNYANKL